MDKPILFDAPAAKRRFTFRHGAGTCYVIRQNQWLRFWAVSGGKIVSIHSGWPEIIDSVDYQGALVWYAKYVKTKLNNF
jgi:hypothetical protein